MRCECRTCVKLCEYRLRWHERVTAAYRWALAHERAQNAWLRPSTQRAQAWAVARAQAREMRVGSQDQRTALQTYAQLYFGAEEDLGGPWEWTVAEPRSKTVF